MVSELRVNRAELVTNLQETANYNLPIGSHVTKKQAQAVLEAFKETVTDALDKGEQVRLHGFGTFGVVVREPREYTTPQGITKKLGHRQMPVFTYSSVLRSKVIKNLKV